MRTFPFLSIAFLFVSVACLAATAKPPIPDHKPTAPPISQAAPLPAPIPQATQESTGAPDSHEEAEGDQRGTETAPLAVKLLNTGQSNKEAAEQANRVRQKDEDDRWSANWTIGLTGALVFATVLQFGALFYQGYWLRRSVVVAERALTVLERAYIFFGRIKEQGFAVSDDNKQISFTGLRYSLVNHGRTPAVLTEVFEDHRFFDIGIEPAPIDPFEERGQLQPIGTGISGAGEHEMIYSFRPIRPTDSRDFILVNTRKKSLYFTGYVRYVDILGKRHRTGFCYLFHPFGDGFIAAGDERYNYTVDEE